ncbi:type VI secretion system tip protein VgrG [Duganella sp. BJB1802]|nr:type VI secretion system Vgr family protein [Duganella sp. BJB1802]NVD74192.1 type VI secretion system tip protein VgrG [Duganella sp. BJB1802]
MGLAKELVTSNRPLRLRLDLPGGVNDDMLLPQRVFGSETLCGGIEYRVLCVSSNAQLPLKQMIAVPAALDFVTDQGDLRSVCGIVTEACSGDSDGGLASYQLVLRDALALLEKRNNTRVFRNMDEVEIVQRILNEWRQNSSILGVCFKHELDEFFTIREYPQREFTMQHNESDAAFIRRLLKRRGIGWYVRAVGGEYPVHTLVLFNNADSLRRNAAGTIRYHRDAATEERDTITSWSAVRSLQAGKVTRHSWDYRNPLGRDFMMADVGSGVDQGLHGNDLAASLDDYQILAPHAGDDNEDLCRLGKLRMSRHDFESKCFHGEGSVRDLCAGEYFTLAEHPEVDRHPAEERDFVVTALQVNAQNNLPKALAARVEKLFARSRWMQGGQELQMQRDVADKVASGPLRMHIQFTAVRRGVIIVPAYDPRTDLPQALMQSAIVVGPKGEEVHCDQMGRVKIRFPGTRAADHEEAAGRGASDSDRDSAWVRVASNWAGNGSGSLQQCGTVALPRVGTEVLVNFLGGDPDKPVIVGQLYNQQAQPPALSSLGDLPGNRYLSGIKSREVRGGRANQLMFDDTNGEISAQLASAHGKSELNLGFLTQRKVNGWGKPRGEGVELRSDESVAVRGAKGLLLTAWQGLAGEDMQLAREEFLGLLAQCADLAQSLGKCAEGHQALPMDTSELDSNSRALVKWDVKEPVGSSSWDAGVAVTAPGGITFAAPQAVITYTGTNLESFAGRHLHFGAGGSVVVNSGQGVSFFAKDGGVRAIAHQGKILLQSQNDEAIMHAAKDIKLTACNGNLTATAKEIVLIAEDGSYIKIGGGITIATAGAAKHHGAIFSFEEGATMSVEVPQPSVSDVNAEHSESLAPHEGTNKPVGGGEPPARSGGLTAKTEDSSSSNKVAPTTAGELRNVKSVESAPSRIVLTGMQAQFDSLWKDSFPNGRSKESGGTIVANGSGRLSLTNPSTGDSSDTYMPNLNVLGNQTVLGAFHTHPYDDTEYNFVDSSLSGADAAYMINNGHTIMMAQSGEGQFLFLRTAQTPATVDYDAVSAEQNKMVEDLMSSGYEFDKATQMAARATAKKYGMAYYEGKNGTLDIVSH